MSKCERLTAKINQMHTQVHTFTLAHKHIHINRSYLLLARLVICKSTNGQRETQIKSSKCTGGLRLSEDTKTLTSTSTPRRTRTWC